MKINIFSTICIIVLMFSSNLGFAKNKNFCQNTGDSCFEQFIGEKDCAHDEVICSEISLGFRGVENFKGCPFEVNEDMYKYQKSCIEYFYTNHQFRKPSFEPFKKAIQKPVNDRIIDLSSQKEYREAMVDYLTVDNVLFGFPYGSIDIESDSTVVDAAVKGLNELPEALGKYIRDHFYGFIIVKGVGWTGFASDIEVEGTNFKPGAVILINADNMKNKNLSEWLVFRESTAIQKPHRLKISYEKKGEQSTVADNFYHFLLHETAHLIAHAVPEIHPHKDFRRKPMPLSYLEAINPSEPLKSFPFLQNTWEFIKNDEEVSLRRKMSKESLKILETKKIQFYGENEEKKLTGEEASTLYGDLSNGCFSSLYAAVDFTEDFAETVTHYFMNLEGFDYKVKFRDSKGKLSYFKDRIFERKKCREKVVFIENLFAK